MHALKTVKKRMWKHMAIRGRRIGGGCGKKRVLNGHMSCEMRDGAEWINFEKCMRKWPHSAAFGRLGAWPMLAVASPVKSVPTLSATHLRPVSPSFATFSLHARRTHSIRPLPLIVSIPPPPPPPPRF